GKSGSLSSLAILRADAAEGRPIEAVRSDLVTHLEHKLSALPPIADTRCARPRFREVPIAVVSRCSKCRYTTLIYSITSLARASSDGEMVRPSAFAVLRFMMRSNLVGCSTGRSAGFAPRKILST